MAGAYRTAKSIAKDFVTGFKCKPSFLVGMTRKRIQNSDLDLIGKKLIERGSFAVREIDEIVSNPELFGLINARIAVNGKTPTAAVTGGSYLFSFIRRNAIAFAGTAIVVTAGIAAMSLLRSEKVPIAANAVQVPAAMPVAARPDLPPQEVVVGRNPSPGRAADRDVVYEKAVVRQPSINNGRKPQLAVSSEPDGEFYAISYGGDPSDASDGGRVVRVDMKRSSLFAMGVNVPLENDGEFVKADLLVGRDGVTRAIRVIK